MATYYVRNPAGGAPPWDTAFPTVADAIAAATVVGDEIKVSRSHGTVVLGGSADLVAPAAHTKLRPLRIYAVEDGDENDSLSSYGGVGEAEVNGGTTQRITFGGNLYLHGLRFQHGQGSSTWISGDAVITMENCLIRMTRTSSQNFRLSAGAVLRMIDSDVDLSGANHVFGSLYTDGTCIIMHGGSYIHTGVATPTKFFECVGDRSGRLELYGVDFSASNTPVQILDVLNNVEHFTIRTAGCKWPAGHTFMDAQSRSYLKEGTTCVDVSLSDPVDQEHNVFQGQVLKSGTIYRSGGSTDGTSGYSLQFIVAGATDNGFDGYRHMLAFLRNVGDLNGRTLTVHFASNTGTPLRSRDISMHVIANGGIAFANKADPGETGVEHPDESGNEDWRDGVGALAGYEEQSMSVTADLPTSGSAVVYVRISDDFTTDNLFVCGKIEVT